MEGNGSVVLWMYRLASLNFQISAVDVAYLIGRWCKGHLWVLALKRTLCGICKIDDVGERKRCFSVCYVVTCLASLKFQLSLMDLVYLIERCVKNTFYGFSALKTDFGSWYGICKVGDGGGERGVFRMVMW